jgi:hypothetical protein
MQMMNGDRNSSDKTGFARTCVPWILIGLALGALGGAIRAHQTLNKNSRYVSQLMAVSEYENLALLQYKHADTDHAKQAMQDLLGFMDHVEASQLVEDKRPLEFDRSLTSMRLALLDEKSGDIEASQKHMAATEESIQITDPSEAHLRQIIARLDSYLP